MAIYKIGKQTGDVEYKGLDEAIDKFASTKEQIDTLNAVLKEQKEIICQKAKKILENEDGLTITISTNEASLKVSFGYETTIKDEGKLLDLLEGRFNDLVETKVSHKPSKKLCEMSVEDEGILSCLATKEKAPTVSVVK